MSLTSDLLDRYFENNDKSDELKLNNQNIIDVEPDAFKNCRQRKIRALNFLARTSYDGHTLNLSKKHSALFKPLREHLEELNVSCYLKCDFNYLKHLNNLKKLKLSYSLFFKEKPVFKQANNQLTHLDLSNTNLEISDKTMFNDLKHLKYLDLSGVKLANNVLPDLFSELKQLETLKIIGTKFTPVQNAFIHLENLNELHFDDNETKIQLTNIFAPLKNIQKLELSSKINLDIGAWIQFEFFSLSHLTSQQPSKLF